MTRKYILGWMAMLAVTPAAAYAGGPGPATLQLVFDQPCYAAGATATVSVRMVNLGSPASGFQAFLGFDTAKLTFTGGSYTSSPFGLPVITPITASGGNIDLASGINQAGGQTPTTADSTLATLTFTVNTANDCSATTSSLFFRPHDPPSRVTNVDGQSLLPLTLVDTPVQNNGPATIRLVYDKACYQMGETVNVAVRVEDICSPAAGFQAFLAFNTSQLSFVSGSYTSSPFGLPVITPITAVGPNIDIASGINQLGGQTPMVGSATVANLVFTAVTTTDCATTTANLTFRTHDPPSRVTTLCGTELTPLTLIDTPVLNTGPATLRISFDDTCYVDDGMVVATIHLENLCTPAAGFQAFLSYDTDLLTFSTWSYEPSPFGLPVLNTLPDVNPNPGEIDVASGINQLGGQNPTTANSVLVRLTFTANAGADCTPVVPIAFRSHDPPTRVTTICGTELLPRGIL